MLLLDKLPSNSGPSPLRSGILREFVVRQDRTPHGQRIDLPEIQDSFRISFSEAAVAASTEGPRNVLQKATPTDERGAAELKLRAYLEIAAL